MKSVKMLVLTLSALLLTGCYTQLQLSDTRPQAENKSQVEEAKSQQGESSVYTDDNEGYIPIYYKDYAYETSWQNCCNPHKTYNFYGDNYYFPSHSSWYTYHRPYHGSFYGMSRYHNWHMRRHFGSPFYASRFSISFSWGYGYHPYYHYDPFYYDPWAYGYGYYSPTYNNFVFYQNYGQGYYGGGSSRDNSNTQYGPRSFGTDRVSNNVSRTRNSAVSTNKSKIQNRSSVSTSRSRGVVKKNAGTTVRQSRSRGNDDNRGSVIRSRSRENVKQKDDGRSLSGRDGMIRSRTINTTNSLERVNRSSEVTERLRSLRAPEVRNPRNIQKERPIFFNRVKSFFKHTGSSISNRSSSSNIGTRILNSSSNRSTTIRSNSSSRSTSVTRSSSSSSNSRSRGSSSSSSRSRSGGDSSSSSDRSRGNN